MIESWESRAKTWEHIATALAEEVEHLADSNAALLGERAHLARCVEEDNQIINDLRARYD